MVQTGAMLHDVFERDRVRTGLVEVITKLCKNGLKYSTELCVEGLLGITLDNKEVLLVNIKEIIKGKKEDGFYRNSFGSESFSEEASMYDKPLDFSSKVRSFPNESTNSGTCQEQRPGRASRKRKPKHISETIILDNDDDEVIIEGPTAGSISNFHSNAVDFSTKSCKPQVPIATQVKRTQEANSYARRGTPPPIGRGSPCPTSVSPSSPAISGSKAASTAISHNSSIPQAALVTPTAKKPKLIQGLFRSQVLENSNNKDSQQQQQQQHSAQATGQDLTVQDKIGNLIQSAVDSVVGKVHSNLVQQQSHSSSKPTNTDNLQNALETAVRSAHADSYQKQGDAVARGGIAIGDVVPPSPTELGRLVIVEPSGVGEEDDNTANDEDKIDLTNNSENNTDSKNGAGKKEDDALSSSSSSRSLQTTPDPCKQQSVSATPITLFGSYLHQVKRYNRNHLWCDQIHTEREREQ